MPRISGIDIPGNKQVRTSLQYIYGIGVNWHLSKEVRLQILWQHLDYGKYRLGLSGDRNERDDRIKVQLSIAVF